MAKSKRRKRTKKIQPSTGGFIVTGIVSFFAVTRLGFIGNLAANIIRFFVGDFYVLIAGLLLFLSIYGLFTNHFPQIKQRHRFYGVLLMAVAALVLKHALLFGPVMNPEMNIFSATWRFFIEDALSNQVTQALGGGMIGAILYAVFHFLFAQPGTYIIVTFMGFTGLLLILNISYSEFFKRLGSDIQAVFQWVSGLFVSDKPQKARTPKKARKPKAEKKTADIPVQTSLDLQEKEKKTARPSIPIDGFMDKETAKPTVETSEVTISSSASDSGKNEKEASEVAIDFVGETENEDYTLPPLSLLDKAKVTDQSAEYDVIEANIEKLEKTFKSFGVDAKVVKANLGPAVTKYEIQPATGVKVSKIVNLQNDIALALAAKDIRIEAPIPGRALIGIEVPNKDVSFVSFREVMEKTHRDPKELLNVPLGKDISGNITMADISKMPHLLIAGATGSGKSVAINGIITALLMRTKPNEVKLMMVDPKMVELNVYNGVPHLLTPVVTNPKKAARALNKVVQEMERRYELFAASGTRNRASYNEFVDKRNQESGEELPRLPFIVVIVDELADLMMVASKEVEDAIMRLAQMARAAGIHMILATQRPSVDVLTGTIKANVPSRIAFSVSSGTDSRTIIDMNGAEKLLGRGDMLYLPMGSNQPARVQGSFISDSEVEMVVEFVKNQQEVSYVEEMIPEDEPTGGLEDMPEDEYYEDAKTLVVEQQTASISYLQRRFRIGYNRAANIMDELERHSVVGPPNGSKPRDVLIQPEPEENMTESPTE